MPGRERLEGGLDHVAAHQDESRREIRPGGDERLVGVDAGHAGHLLIEQQRREIAVRGALDASGPCDVMTGS